MSVDGRGWATLVDDRRRDHCVIVDDPSFRFSMLSNALADVALCGGIGHGLSCLCRR